MKIFNASPLILLLEEIEEPEIISLFSGLDKELIVPQRVKEEIISKKAKNNLEGLVNKGIISICNNCSEDNFNLFQKRFPMLDDGELTVISLAYEEKRKDCGVIIDEFLGRSVATKLNLDENNLNKIGGKNVTYLFDPDGGSRNLLTMIRMLETIGAIERTKEGIKINYFPLEGMPFKMSEFNPKYKDKLKFWFEKFNFDF